MSHFITLVNVPAQQGANNEATAQSISVYLNEEVCHKMIFLHVCLTIEFTHLQNPK